MYKTYRVFFFTSLILSMPLFSMDDEERQIDEIIERFEANLSKPTEKEKSKTLELLLEGLSETQKSVLLELPKDLPQDDLISHLRQELNLSDEKIQEYLQQLSTSNYRESSQDKINIEFDCYMEACKKGDTVQACELLSKSNLFAMGLHSKLNEQRQTGLLLAYERGHKKTAQALFPLHRQFEDTTFDQWRKEHFSKKKSNLKKRASFLKRSKTHTQ